MPTLIDSTDKNLGTFVISANQTRGNNNFIDRCQQYNYDFTCAKCHTGYILTVNKLLCKAKENNSTLKLANCAVANNDNDNCNKCDDDKYSLTTANGCVQGQIANCMTY